MVLRHLERVNGKMLHHRISWFDMKMYISLYETKVYIDIRDRHDFTPAFSVYISGVLYMKGEMPGCNGAPSISHNLTILSRSPRVCL